MIYFPETIIQWVQCYWGYLHPFSCRLCTLTHSVHACVLKPWRGRLPSVFSSYHVFSSPLSGLNWRSLTPPGGQVPFPPKWRPLPQGPRTLPYRGPEQVWICFKFASAWRNNWLSAMFHTFVFWGRGGWFLTLLEIHKAVPWWLVDLGSRMLI